MRTLQNNIDNNLTTLYSKKIEYYIELGLLIVGKMCLIEIVDLSCMNVTEYD